MTSCPSRHGTTRYPAGVSSRSTSTHECRSARGEARVLTARCALLRLRPRSIDVRPRAEQCTHGGAVPQLDRHLQEARNPLWPGSAFASSSSSTHRCAPALTALARGESSPQLGSALGSSRAHSISFEHRRKHENKVSRKWLASPPHFSPCGVVLLLYPGSWMPNFLLVFHNSHHHHHHHHQSFSLQLSPMR